MKLIAFDIETTGLSPYNGDKIFAFAVCDESGKCDVYRKNYLNELRRLFAQHAEIICHNYKFELSFLIKHNITINKNIIWHDTMLLSQILRSNQQRHDLGTLANELCNYPETLDKRIYEMFKAYGNFEKIPEHLMTEYQKTDVERTMILFKTFWPAVSSNAKLLEDYQNEIRLVQTTQRLEQRGIMLDRLECRALLDWLGIQLYEVQQQCREVVGDWINLGSPKQVTHLLFTKLKLPIIALQETTGNILSDKNVLMELREKHPHPVLDLVIKHRSYTKGMAMIKSYVEKSVDGILHPNILTNGAHHTGRESSSSPNLQNISKSLVDERKNPFPVPARKCFRARPGNILLLIDYAGIEMRLIADACGEQEILDLINIDGDPHGLAAQIFYDTVKFTKLQRSLAKSGQFAIAYGATSSKLAGTLGLNMAQGRGAFLRYVVRFPKVANFAQYTALRIRKDGFIITPFGRKLYVNPMKAYIGGNALIQGMAAGILKRAQNRIDEFILNNYLNKMFLLLPIHDELIIEISRELLPELNKIINIISGLMTNGFDEIKVKLGVECKITTTTWEAAHEYKTVSYS